jgi:hypothetical protein
MQGLQRDKLGHTCQEMGIEMAWCDKVDELQPCEWVLIRVERRLSKG